MFKNSVKVFFSPKLASPLEQGGAALVNFFFLLLLLQHLSLEVSSGPYCSLLTCWYTAPVNGAARDPSAPASPAPENKD